MIMPRSSDLLTVGYCPTARLRVTHVEATDSARALEQGHLCGPTAGLVLAEALAGVALLGAELVEPDETVTLRMQVSGPVRGLLVEANRNGSLRGYTHVKIIDDLDRRDDIEGDEALGDRATAQVIRSVPGRLIGQASFDVQPATVCGALESYFRQSLQRRVAFELGALTYGGFVDLSRGFAVECLPDGDPAEFERIVALIEDGTVLESLESCGSLVSVCTTLGLADVTAETPRPLKFACRCSRARVESLLGSMKIRELDAMIAEGKPACVQCHMCGVGYEIPVDRLQAIAQTRRARGVDKPPHDEPPRGEP
jgi:molecular chaperone Hsp33